MPTPWNANTKLMHVAIKGYDVQPAEQPKANLVFLIDVSGSMNAPDKLPLLQSAFRLLVTKLEPRGHGVDRHLCRRRRHRADADQGVRAREDLSRQSTIFSPAARRPARPASAKPTGWREESFVQGGVNRVMLATDGDFNVGQTDDDDLKRIIEEKRKSRRLPVGVRLRPRQPQRPDDADASPRTATARPPISTRWPRPRRCWSRIRPRRSSRSPRT